MVLGGLPSASWFYTVSGASVPQAGRWHVRFRAGLPRDVNVLSARLCQPPTPGLGSVVAIPGGGWAGGVD